MVSIRVISDEQGLRAIAPQWNRVLQASASDSFFLTWEWVGTWWEVYGRGRCEPLTLVAEDQGEIVGIAPLMTAPAAPFGSLERQLAFVGQGADVRPEYLDFFVRAGREAEITPLFCRQLARGLRGRWDSLLFETVLDSSPNLQLMTRAFADEQITVARPRQVPSYFAALPAGFDEFLRSKSTHFRKRVNYNRNRLAREGEVRYRFAASDISVGEAFDALVRLNHERWGDEGASFRSDLYVRFHRTLCERIEPLGWLLLVVVDVGDKLVAAKYDYCYGGKVWGNQGGWSLEHEKLEVGTVVIARLIEWAIEHELPEYDFLGGEAEYKQRWGTGTRTMHDLQASSGTIRARALQLARRGKDAIKEHVPEGAWERIKGLRRKLPI